MFVAGLKILPETGPISQAIYSNTASALIRDSKCILHVVQCINEQEDKDNYSNKVSFSVA